MRNILIAALLALATPVFAGDIDIQIDDAYARVGRPGAPTGAAFMVIRNTGDTDDRLIAAATPDAKLVELHTHIDAGNGVMQMRPVEDGFVIPAGGEHALMRGGDHVMMMGLTRALAEGDEITLTLTFEKAGEMALTVPVDNVRGQMMNNSGAGN